MVLINGIIFNYNQNAWNKHAFYRYIIFNLLLPPIIVSVLFMCTVAMTLYTVRSLSVLIVVS